MKRATWLVEVLRDAGVDTRGYPGWLERGRDFEELTAVVWHHDASPKGDSPGVPTYMLRQMAAGKAAAQLWVDRHGRWHILAAGVAFHAGNVRPGMPGNYASLGVETDHTTGEEWPQAQIDSLRRGTAAILRRVGQDESGLHMHKTICDPVGRKTDPDGLDLDFERVKVRELLRVKALSRVDPQPITDVQEDDMAAGFIFNDGEKTYLRDGGDLVHVPTMEDVNALLALGFKDGRRLSAEMTRRLVEAAKQ